MDNYSLERNLAEVVTMGGGLSCYRETDYEKATKALIKCGWKPVNCQRPGNKLACKVMDVYDSSVQVFYNCATKKKYAFLGYHKVRHCYADGRPPEDILELWLRVLGDNE